jgi:hypothetical protein
LVDFKFHLQEDTYVLWIAGINRYLQLKEPAFRVFEQWAKGIDVVDIAKWCSTHYKLPDDESLHFVKEITSEISTLFEAEKQVRDLPEEDRAQVENPYYFIEYTYLMGNHSFKFIYRNEYLKELFHPLFQHHETNTNPDTLTTFDLYNKGNQDVFSLNDGPAKYFPVDEIDAFQGAVMMEILNAIHGKKMADWMGVLHASAVTDGKSAVIFTAPSGSGKSTIALLMIVNGFKILSDDFVPVAMQVPEIYHFPSGISVKKGAIPFLKEYLPQLNEQIRNETEFYLPPSGEPGILTNVNAKAIVFVKYDPLVDFELKKESNLEKMNHFIKQSWIAGSPEAAEKFLGWYFNLQVYTLRYSNNFKAVEGIREIFG